MKKHFRILIFDPSNRNPVHSARLIEALSELCYVDVVMPFRREESEISAGEIVERYRKLKLKGTKGFGKLINYFRGWHYVLKHANRYDLIHIGWLSLLDRSSLEIFLLRKLLKKNPRLVYTVHDVLPLYRKIDKGIQNRFQRFYKILPAIQVHSYYAKKMLESLFSVPGSKIYVSDLAPLLKPDSLDKRDKDANYFGIIGTLSRYKGVTDAIRAFSLISNRIKENLLLAGGIDSNYRQEVEKLISDLNLCDRVSFIGRYLTVQEVIEYHRKVRVTLLPYYQITQSGAALTSMAFGVPVVAYDVGAMPEYIKEGFNGYLVPKGDIVKLAETIEKVLKEPGIDFQNNCLRYVGTKSWSTVAEQTIEIYKHILER